MNWLVILLLLILIWRVGEGFKRGLVKEIISLVSLIVMCIAVLLLGRALSEYMEKDIISMMAAILLLLLLLIAHRAISFIFFSAKLLSKLPVINIANKLTGAVFGAAETVFFIWTVFSLIMIFGMGILGQQILVYVQDSQTLSFLYRYNLLAQWVGVVAEKVAALPL